MQRRAEEMAVLIRADDRPTAGKRTPTRKQQAGGSMCVKRVRSGLSMAPAWIDGSLGRWQLVVDLSVRALPLRAVHRHRLMPWRFMAVCPTAHAYAAACMALGRSVVLASGRAHSPARTTQQEMGTLLPRGHATHSPTYAYHASEIRSIYRLSVSMTP